MAKTSNNNLKYSLISIGVVIVIFLILVIVKSPTTQNTSGADVLAPSSLVNSIESLDNTVIQSVGKGSSNAQPISISGPSLSQNGKPTMLYMGAEYCPYCATERWPMAVALTRFGTFSGLGETHSSTTDVYPDTQTLSFYKSTFTSQYLNFTPVEVYSNIASGTGYTSLQKPTSEQQSLEDTYDSPPYVPSADAGSIPFMYFGGKYILTGASYSPSTLAGKSYNNITTALKNPKSAISQGVFGTANIITATICKMTNDQPSNVCTPAIQSIEKTL
jgi:hypothetical protein